MWIQNLLDWINRVTAPPPSSECPNITKRSDEWVQREIDRIALKNALADAEREAKSEHLRVVAK